MKKVGLFLFTLALAVVPSILVGKRLAGEKSSRNWNFKVADKPAPVTIDYPGDGSIFPPEFPPTTFLWRDAAEQAAVWAIEIRFGDHSSPVQVRTAGRRMQIGEIDPQCIAPTNELPKLTAEQAAARTGTPDGETWAALKQRSVKKPAVISISGFRESDPNLAVSRGQISILTSNDPVGAPIFYRDVPLMPNQSDKGVIVPIPPDAIGLIKWRLRDVGQIQSRVMMGGLPTCANCHSFSNDGSTLGMDVDGPANDKGLYTLVPVKPATVIRNEDVIKWSTFQGKLGGKLRAASMSQVSPDGRYVVTTIDDPLAPTRGRAKELRDKYYGINFKDYRFLQVFYPTRGILAWYGRERGLLQPLPGADDEHYVQTDGVWSPKGDYIVFARAEAKDPFPPGARRAEYANDPNEAQIQYDLYRVPFRDGKGGTPERIEGASQNGMSNNFPKVSPDGRWIVFVQCRNGQLMRPDSQLYLVPFGGGQPRKMKCNTSLMNSWHSFSPNGRWMVFSSKSRSPYTQMFLTHLDEDGNDSPALLIENATAANRAVNIPEFVNVPQNGFSKLDAPATDFFRAFNQAFELVQKEQFRESIPVWQKAIELNAEEGKAYYNFAVALEHEGRTEEAILNYTKSVNLDTENEAAFINLAVALTGTERADEAINVLTRALVLHPGNAKVENNLGLMLLEKGRLPEAIGHFSRALEIDPESPEAHNSLGIALARSGKLELAVWHLEEAASLAPKSPEFQFNLGRILAAQKKFSEAIPHLEQAAALSGGEDPFLLELLAGLYSELGRFPEAAQIARRGLSLAERQNNRDLAGTLKARISYYESQR